ncbi:tetratricopeptide repeat protein [Lutibacter sp.]
MARFNFELNQDKAIFYAKEAFLKAKDENNNQHILQAAQTVADAYYYRDEFVNAIDYYKITANIEKQLSSDSSNKYGERLADIGYCFQLLGVFDIANSYYEKSLAIAQKNNNTGEIHSIINNIGSLYFKWGQYDKAINAFVQTLEYDKKQGNNANLSASCNNIGKVYFVWEKYEQAIAHYNLALEYSKKTGDNSKIAIRYANLGMAYFKMGNFEKALLYLNNALALDKKQGNEFKVAIRKSEIGKIIEAQGDYFTALNFQLKALKTFKQLKIQDSQSLTYINIAEIYKHLKEFKKSEDNYLKAIKIANTIGLVYNEMIAYKGLSNLYKITNQFQKALDSYEKYSFLNRELFNKENNKQIAIFQVKFETEKKEKEISILKNEAIIKDIKISKNRILWLSFLVISLLLLSIAYVYIKKHKLKVEVNKILEKKNTQLQLLNATKTKFFAIISHDLLNPIAAFHTLSNAMEESFNAIPKEKLLGFIKELNTSSEKMHLLLQNLLAWASINNGRMKFNPENIALNSLVEEVIAIQKINADVKELVISNTIPTQTGIYTDRLMIATVLRNLISNAIKFSPEKSQITISAKKMDTKIHISVKDTGIGISEVDIQKLFKIEIDTKAIGTSNGKGTGLGLILCKELVEKCGGKIWVKSTINKGSEFIFSVPKKITKFEYA